MAVDPRVLKTLEQNIGRQMMLRLVMLFREATTARVARLDDICAAGDFAALRRLAHDWVSDASSIGAKKLSETARRVEACALAGDMGAFEEARELETLSYAADAALAELIGDAA